MAYYFLVASLPTLSLDDPPAVTNDEFLQTCESELGRRDYEDVLSIMRNEPENAENPFVAKWLCREILLRNAIVSARASRLGVDPDPFLKHCEFYESYPDEAVSEIMRRGVDEASGETTPLEKELALDRFRWEMTDEMAVLTPFGVEAVLAFALKLNIARRWAGLEKKQGRDTVDSFIEHAFDNQ